MGLGVLIDGKWVPEREQEDDQGKFVRPSTTFRNWITADGSSEFKAEPDRYHLYVSLACPWAHRTLIVRQLKGLTDVISVSVVDPVIDQNSWEFSDAPGSIPDCVNQTQYLWQIYLKAEPNYTGRSIRNLRGLVMKLIYIQQDCKKRLTKPSTQFTNPSTTVSIGRGLPPRSLLMKKVSQNYLRHWNIGKPCWGNSVICAAIG
jgi:hypothetical protein